MKNPSVFNHLDFVSFPVGDSGKEKRSGFVFQVWPNQIDICAARHPKAKDYSKLGIHKKYIEKKRFGELSVVSLDKDMTKWGLCTVVLWAMVRLYMTDGDFISDHIKPILNNKDLQEKHKKILLIERVRDHTIGTDRRKVQYQKAQKAKSKKGKPKELKMQTCYTGKSPWSTNSSS